MCLDLKPNYKVQTAKKDIVVYKVCRYLGGDIFSTAYQGAIVKIGETYTSELIVNIFKNTVNVGLHSFENISDAINLAQRWSTLHYKVIKCIIPKGSSYYEGMFISSINNAKAYASDTLKYIEVVE